MTTLDYVTLVFKQFDAVLEENIKGLPKKAT
jgi:hypothetical protein